MPTETLTFDQVHLGVPDPEIAARWYVEHLGAAPGDNSDRIWFGPTRIIFLKNASPAPSEGAAIDHFALAGNVGRVPSAFAKAPADRRSFSGGRPDPSIRPVQMDPAYIADPWGTKIQLVEDAGPLRVHHVHLRVPDVEQARSWYLDRFGGERAALDGRPGIKYGDVWVLLDEGAAPPSRGHAIDHVGWRTPDLLALAAEVKRKGVTFSTEPQPGPPGAFSPVLMSFTEDPWGVKIELLQRHSDA